MVTGCGRKNTGKETAREREQHPECEPLRARCVILRRKGSVTPERHLSGSRRQLVRISHWTDEWCKTQGLFCDHSRFLHWLEEAVVFFLFLRKQEVLLADCERNQSPVSIIPHEAWNIHRSSTSSHNMWFLIPSLLYFGERWRTDAPLWYQSIKTFTSGEQLVLEFCEICLFGKV